MFQALERGPHGECQHLKLYARRGSRCSLSSLEASITAVRLGLRSKLEILVDHALRTAKHIFVIPNFPYYALADGIKDIMSRSLRCIEVKVTGKQPQLEFAPLL